MLKVPVFSGSANAVTFGKVVPLKPKRSDAITAIEPKPVFGGGDTVKFGAAPKETILDDPFLVNFNVDVNPGTVAQLNGALVQIAQQKKQMGGSIKLLINSPGGEIYSGLQTLQYIKRIGVPVDTIIMGGQAASMGSLLFLAGTGRRVMTTDSSLLFHQPRAGGIGGTLSELEQIVEDMKGLHNRMKNMIVEKTGLTKQQVSEFMDKNLDFRVYPLKALKMGFATHVLLDDGTALTKDTVKGLSDAEIDRRDQDNDYAGLKGVSFDPQIMDPAFAAAQGAGRGRGGRGGGGLSLADLLGGAGGGSPSQDEMGFFSGKGKGIAITPEKPQKEAHESRPRIYLQA